MFGVGAAQAGSGQAVLKNALVLITNWGDDTISVVDLDSGQQLSEIKVGAKPYDVKLDPQGRTAYVSNSAASDISVVDVQAMLESHRIKVGFSPRDMAISKDGKFLVVANSGDATLSMVDLKTSTESKTIKVGSIPYGTQLYGGDKKAVVTNWGENTGLVRESRGRQGNRQDGGGHPAVHGCRRARTVVGLRDELRLRLGLPGRPDDNGEHRIADGRQGAMGPGNLERRQVPWRCQLQLHELSYIDATAFTESARHYVGGRVNVAANDPNATKRNDAKAPARSSEPVQTARSKNVAMSDDGKLIVWTDLANNTVNVTDSASGQTLRTIKVGKAPYGIAFLRKPA